MGSKTIALIPLRGGSKSIPDKNIKILSGKPLCQWVIEAALKSEFIEEVYISTDSLKIKETIENLKLDVKFIDRPPEFATDQSSTESVMLHFSECVKFDTLITIQATSPLLTYVDLDSAFKQFKANDFDSMLSAVKSYRFYWDSNFKPLNYNPFDRPRRQDFKGSYVENGAFYITKRDILNKYECRLGGKVGIFEMDESSFVEIDEPNDWALVEEKLKSL
jgi:CMP-N-acetylneuraminic acid synthetase